VGKTINGLYKSRLYGIHHCMMCRCYTKSASGYEYYGGRGIKVCNEWHDFLTFYNWSIDNGYSDDLSIDRIDTNGDYEPSNCRWATWKEQANNKRDSRFITYNGKTMTLSQWAEYIGIDERTLYKRFSMGWSVEKALTYPVNEKFSRKGSRRVKNF
jgi:hypothetical protein